MPRPMIVMPTYNERENLPLMLDALMSLPVDDLRVLIADDNSPDGTGQVADDFAVRYPGRVHVLHREKKEGLGPAYIAGFKQAIALGADYIIQMDADFSHQPKYIPELIAAAANSDMVIGSRYIKGGSVDESWSFFRVALSWFANRVYTPTILRIPVHDATGGFRLWRRDTLVGMNLDRFRSSGYVFQVELTYVAHRLGFKIAEIPIHFPDRVRDISKMDLRIQIEAALRVWQVLARYRSLTPNARRTEAYSVSIGPSQ